MPHPSSNPARIRLTPFLVGQGRSSQAVTDAIALLSSRMPHIDFQKPVQLERGQVLTPASDGKSIAFICNPHGLHTEKILEASKNGFHGIASEKPVCVSLSQAFQLENVKTPCAVFHVYREMWGPQTLRSMITSGAFGDLIAIEGRYWQSSTAERALKGPAPTAWKNNISLSGPSDTLLDIGTHWVDAAAFLAGGAPSKIEGWASYANAESPHRDSHVHLSLQFAGDVRALTSVSKTVHGATNHFELNVIGTKGSGTWTFMNPDEILIGEGRTRHVIIRDTDQYGSGHPAFHATGWIEGYTQIIHALVDEVVGTGAGTAGDANNAPKDTDSAAESTGSSKTAKSAGDLQASGSTRSYPKLHESLVLVKMLLESGILRSPKS